MRDRLRASVALACAALTGCLGSGEPVKVEQPSIAAVPPRPSPELYAGVHEVDITPPPGLPTYGHASNGVRRAEGYWLRLEARILVLEQDQQRVALVQLDLGAASLLLSRRVAALLADEGIGPHNLMMASTHTHGGPGGLFANEFYNEFVGARPGYDDRLVEWLAQRVASGVRQAIRASAPAQIAVAREPVASGATHNRSAEAWRANFEDVGAPIPEESVDRTLTLLRVDHVDEDGALRPAGVWTVFAVHGTTMPAKFPLYHGDVHGLASRMLRRWVRRTRSSPGFVAAMANGAEGDVSAVSRPSQQGKGRTWSTARAIAMAAQRAFLRAEPELAVPPTDALRVAYREISLAGAATSRGSLCGAASLGAPQLGGSEEGRGPAYGFLRMREGATRRARGCSGTKVKFLGRVQDAILDPEDFPRLVPFQVVAVGSEEDGVLLAGVPGEPTTEVGRAIVRSVSGASRWRNAAVVGLANGYATYFTMPAEYARQHYEGGATLYGPYQGVFAVEQLGALAASVQDGAVGVREYSPREVFLPGEQKDLLPVEDCRFELAAGDVAASRYAATFAWSGPTADQLCAMPAVALLCRGAVAEDVRGVPQTDDEAGFEVRHVGSDRWSATWRGEVDAGAACRIRVTYPDRALTSASFTFREDTSHRAGTPARAIGDDGHDARASRRRHEPAARPR